MYGRHVAVVLRSSANVRLVKPLTSSLPIRLSLQIGLITHRRLYATPGRPKKAVGETSRPIKRTAKKAAKTTKTTETTKTPKNEDVATKTIKARKAAAAKKAKAKPKVPKILTEEQIALQKSKAATLELKQLKMSALKPPSIKHQSAWLMFCMEVSRSSTLSEKGLEKSEVLRRFAVHQKQLSAEWKSLKPSEIEHYNHIAHTAKDESTAAYTAWVNSHTAEEIHLANKARRALRLRLENAGMKKSKVRSSWPPIHDERAVKRPLSAYVTFTMNRYASGDFKNIKVPESSKLIAREWNSLGDSEKQKYHALKTEDTDRYVKEYTHVYGHAPLSQQAAAVA